MNAPPNCASVATRGTPVKDASRRQGGGLKAVLDRGPTRRHRVFRPGRRNDPVQPNKETSLARMPWLLHTLTDTTQTPETPAHAGKGVAGRCARQASPGDPRARGERSMGEQHQVAAIGRPPRTRGKVFRATAEYGKVRETPAHAGKGLRSVTHHSDLRETPAHAGKGHRSPATMSGLAGDPRARGERVIE